YAVGGSLAPVVVNADDGRAAARDAGDQPFLDGGVGAQAAMAVEVILAHVEQDADRGVEARGEIDLIGRAFAHVGVPAARRLEREDRRADVAAALGGMAGGNEQMRARGRRRRLALG